MPPIYAGQPPPNNSARDTMGVNDGHREGNLLISRSQLLTGHIHLDLLEQIVEIATPYNAP